MRFQVNKKELSTILDITSDVVAKKTVNPVLQNIFIEAKEDNTLHILATDLEISAIVNLEAKVEKTGKIVVLNTLFRDIVRSSRTENIIVSEIENGKVQIEDSDGLYKAIIHGINPEHFPSVSLDEIHNAPTFVIEASVLKNMLSKNIPFAAKDEVRYTFNSVYFEKENLELRTVSSDTKRLSLAKNFVDNTIADFTLLVPIKTARIVRDILDDKEVEIKILNKKVAFVYHNMILISNQIEGKFPDYKMVIPRETQYNVLLPKENFAEAIRSLAPFLTGELPKIILSFQNNKMIAWSEENELGTGKTEMSISYEGAPFEICLNYRFLLDILTVLDEEEFFIKVWEVEKPIVFTEKQNNQFIYVTVPMKK